MCTRTYLVERRVVRFQVLDCRLCCLVLDPFYPVLFVDIPVLLRRELALWDARREG